MARHRASPVTVQRAIAALAAEGAARAAARARHLRGAARRRRRPPPDLSWQAVALGRRRRRGRRAPRAAGRPPAGRDPALQRLPVARPAAARRCVGAALARAARRPGAWERGPVEGREELRAWFAREAGGSLRAHDVVVCSGGQPALATAFRALAAPGDPVLVEAPTYLGAIVAARAAGLRVVPVPSDADGVRPDLLAQAFARTGARLVYCQPLYANPHGSVLAADRRAAVLDAVAGAGAFLLEDDWARDLSADGRPAAAAGRRRPRRPRRLRALADQVGRARACAWPASAPAARPERACAPRASSTTSSSRARCRRPRSRSSPPRAGAATAAACAPSCARAATRSPPRCGATCRRSRRPRSPAAACTCGWRLPEGTDDVALASAAAAEGVVVFPGRPWFPAEAPGPFLRLTFAAAPPDALDEGVRRLARALR